MLFSILRSGNVDMVSVIVYILSSLMVIFLVMPVHEWAHAVVANKLGDRTAKYQGRLTLNPLAHIDYMGAAMILLIGFGWAKPVPVDDRYFKKPKRDMALTALAGPVSNLLAAIVSGLIYNLIFVIFAQNTSIYDIVNPPSLIRYTLLFFEYLQIINISLAVFNFIPIPPLDGSKILMAFLPDRLIYKVQQYQSYIAIGFFILVMMGAVGNLLEPVQMLLYKGIQWLTWLPFSWFELPNVVIG